MIVHLRNRSLFLLQTIKRRIRLFISPGSPSSNPAAGFSYKPFYFLLFLFFIYLICFNQLDVLTLSIFDESRVAESSYELYKSNDWIVVKWSGIPDVWSTKPPMLNWLQALCIKLFGMSILSVRLPSAIAGALLLLTIFFFFRKHYPDPLLAYLIPLIFGTSSAFFASDHSFRTADYDAVLTFFSFSACISFFAHIFFFPERKQLIYIPALFFSCAVLTKGAAGLFFGPGLLLYTIISGKTRTLLRNPHFYLATLLFIGIIASYYILRENRAPGYLEAVNNMELFGRYKGDGYFAKDHVDTWLNIFWLVNDRFRQYYLLIPFSLAIIPFTKDEFLRNILLLSSLLSFSLLGILCTASIKGIWYDLPSLPFLSINAGIVIIIFRDIIKKSIHPETYFRKNVENAIILTLISIFGIIPALIKINTPSVTEYPGYCYTTVVQDYISQHRVPKNATYLVAINASQAVYFNVANEEGYNLRVDSIKNVKPGHIYFSAQKEVQNEFESKFNFDIIAQYREVRTYYAKSRKN